MTPRASIIIPSHNRAESLALAVESALAQTVRDVEVLIVGDGVTEAVRETAHGLQSDTRVRFFDHPKGEHHGESRRHDAILAAQSDAIFYLCDDDLFLPEHVSDLLALLETHNFVQSRNGWVRPDGSLEMYPANLADPECVAAIASTEIRYNQVSITGTAHSRRQYELINDRWTTTPRGQWPDHHQWRKFLRRDDFHGATSSRMTALQFPASGVERSTWNAERALDELREWAAIVRRPDAQQLIDALVLAALDSQLEQTTRLLAREVHDRAGADAWLAHWSAMYEIANTELTAMVDSKSWAITEPLRAARRLLGRRR